MLAAAAALAAPAGAAVTLPHSIAVFYHRDFVQGSGFRDGELVTVTARRNGVVIGTATNVPAIDSAPGAGDGLVTVNHPGGSCWDTFTPDLRPGDVITTTTAAATDSTAVADVEVTQQATNAAGSIVVKGFAADAAGNPLPLAQIQQRMVANKQLFHKNGRRDLRAGANGSDGALAYDPVDPVTNPKGINWTATYSGLDATDQGTAVAAESRLIWLGPNPTLVGPGGFPAEATFAEVGGDKPALPGPGSPECPPLATNAVTAVDAAHTVGATRAINLANAGSPLTVSGVSNGASRVSVTLTDASNRAITQSATPAPATAAQSWSVTFPAADVATLADGPLTAAGSYTVAGSPITGTTLGMLKDLVAPGAPSASVPAGQYPVVQSVALNGPDRTATIHHTEDGSTPDAASPTFEPIAITASQTLSAVAIDPAGNASPMARFAYTIAAPAGGAGRGGSAAGPAAILPVPLLRVAGSVSSAPSAVRGLAVPARVGRAALRRRGLRVTMRLPRGARVVQIRVLRAGGRRGGGTVVTVVRRVTAAGPFAATLRDPALRRLARGHYVLEVRAGASRATLGTPSRQAFVVG